MAASNIAGRAQRRAISGSLFRTSFSLVGLDTSRDSQYSGRNMIEARGRRISMSSSTGFGFFWYWENA